MSEHGAIANLAEPLVRYRVHEGSTSRRFAVRQCFSVRLARLAAASAARLGPIRRRRCTNRPTGGLRGLRWSFIRKPPKSVVFSIWPIRTRPSPPAQQTTCARRAGTNSRLLARRKDAGAAGRVEYADDATSARDAAAWQIDRRSPDFVYRSNGASTDASGGDKRNEALTAWIDVTDFLHRQARTPEVTGIQRALSEMLKILHRSPEVRFCAFEPELSTFVDVAFDELSGLISASPRTRHLSFVRKKKIGGFAGSETDWPAS